MQGNSILLFNLGHSTSNRSLDSYGNGKAKLQGSKTTVINMTSEDHYNFSSSDQIKTVATDTLRTYGVGPCGPPGFYGTQDVHMEAEDAVAQHLGTEACIIYAQNFSTISSAIPAFCKRGDVIVADRAINYAVLKGIQISRSNVHWYNHNDMADLERILGVVSRDQEKKKTITRRFIITEALFENTGNISHLPTLVNLKQQYKFRLILDEKNSYGVLGVTGRGLTEEQFIDPAQVDMIVGSLSGAVSTAGGFCAGSKEVVYHQRINSASYCFSAALPAMMSSAATSIINVLKSSEGTRLINGLRDNVVIFRNYFERHPGRIVCAGWDKNPMILVTLSDDLVKTLGWNDDTLDLVMIKAQQECLHKGVLVTRLRSHPTPPDTKESDLIRSSKPWRSRPALRVRISVALTKREIESGARTIRTVLESVITHFQSSQ